ncbi:hypothetical protein MLD38_016615 [Melastoma candidum]|uniref:Uncharacterized protein n=1 Tax=Melastoma candidum TaxID=119954 RepID=A0ACB9QS00_9MYRT|nr:hypothetical protein MLD38_016615 [Melastoma candidum]
MSQFLPIILLKLPNRFAGLLLEPESEVGQDALVGGLEEAVVFAGDVEDMVSDTLSALVELDGAELALAVAVAVAGEAHGHGTIAGEEDEAEVVGDGLVVEDG